MGATADKLIAQRAAAAAATQEAADKLAAAKLAAAEAKTSSGSSGPWTAKSGGVLNPATPGGAGSVAGLVCIAGAIAFFGNMKVDKAFPKAGVRIISATILLALLLSLFDNGKLSQPLRWLGYLMILSAAIKYVPVLSNSKGKKNG